MRLPHLGITPNALRPHLSRPPEPHSDRPSTDRHLRPWLPSSSNSGIAWPDTSPVESESAAPSREVASGGARDGSARYRSIRAATDGSLIAERTFLRPPHFGQHRVGQHGASTSKARWRSSAQGRRRARMISASRHAEGSVARLQLGEFRSGASIRVSASTSSDASFRS